MSTKSVVLTAKQKIHTLSAKKNKSKKTLRYVLAQPLPRYWPRINDAQSEEVFKLLMNIRQKQPEWFTGKKVKSTNNKSIHCGLQASIRKLKSGRNKLLVLSADLKPRYVANQIIVQALSNNPDIRILCVANMTKFTEILLNFPCYALVVGSEHWCEMPELDTWTTKIIGENFPLPPLIKEHFTKQQNLNAETPMEVDDQCHIGKQNDIPAKNILGDCDSERLYLTRHCDANERAFVPKNAINLKPIALEIQPLNKIKSDFISLETYSNSNDRPQCSDFKSPKGFQRKGKRPLALYRELTIHKIQNNPNKVKKSKDKKNKKKNKQQ